jgi:hypothetical protein
MTFTSVTVLILVGCGSDGLKPLDQIILQSLDTKSAQVNFCTEPAFDQKLVQKTVIILDHSGSNQNGYQMDSSGSGAPVVVNGLIDFGPQYGTDPMGTLRYGSVTQTGTLLNYLANIPPNDPTDPTQFFGLVNFSSGAQTYPPGSSGFTSDTVAFYNQILSESIAGGSAPADAGGTSYLSALTAAYNMINNDIQVAKSCASLPRGSASPGAWCPNPGVAVASAYVIVFMTDGSPIINTSGITVGPNGDLQVIGTITFTKESSVEILAKVSAIQSLTANTKFVAGVNLFTIYYYLAGNFDNSGRVILQQMAKAGNGIAYDALSGSNIDYQQFQPPKKRIKFTLSDIFLGNASTTRWDDGVLHLDTDMDGLPDDEEIVWGSNPANALSDGSGISDLVRYNLALSGSTINTGTLCSGIARDGTLPGNPYISSDPNGLNNCEKALLNDVGGIDNPDSNADLIPDWLEFKAGVPFQVGTVPAVNKPLSDGFSIYQKIKLGLPINVANSQVFNFAMPQYKLSLLSTTSVQDCYRLDVSGLPYVGEGNTIRVDVIEKSDLLKDSYLYKVGKKAFAAGSNSVKFNDWNDPAEKLLKTWQVWP